VFGSCAIDGLAGPSEVLVVADDSANVEYVAGELRRLGLDVQLEKVTDRVPVTGARTVGSGLGPPRNLDFED